MAQGGVCGILDCTAGGNVFGIYNPQGFVGTQSGHKEGSRYGRTPYSISISFEEKFKNVPTVTISNMKITSDYEVDYSMGNVTKNSFSMSFEAVYETFLDMDYSFDWTATGK